MKGRLFSIFKLYRGLPGPVYVLFFATVVNGAGIFVFPFLTLFLTRKLGLDERQAGNFMFFTSIAYLPGAMLGGRLADRYGRKIVAVGAQLLAAAVYVPCGLLTRGGFAAVAVAAGGSVGTLGPLPISGPLAAIGLGAGLGAATLVPLLVLVNVVFDGFADPARMAIHTDLTTAENRQAAFSLNYLGHNLGFAIGPLIAGFLFNAAPEWLFWGNALAVAVATTLVAIFIPETKPTEQAIRASLETDSTEKAHIGGLVSAALTRPYLIAFVFMGASFGLVYAQHRFTIPLQTEKLFGAKGAALYGSLMTLNALLVLVFTAPLIAALKKNRAIVNVSFSMVLIAVGFGMLAFVRSPLLFYLSTFIWTMGEIIDATNTDVYIANHTPMSHRGRFNSIIPVIGGFGWALSTPVGGNIIHAAGIPVLWIVMFAIAASGAVGLFLLDRAEQRSLARAASRGGAPA